MATISPCPIEPNQKRLLVLSTIYPLTPADIVKKIVPCASCGAGYLNDISPTFHGHHPTDASYQFTSALFYKTADKTINKESLSNHHGVEIKCDISGSEEYTPFAKLLYGPAPRAQTRGLGSDLGG